MIITILNNTYYQIMSVAIKDVDIYEDSGHEADSDSDNDSKFLHDSTFDEAQISSSINNLNQNAVMVAAYNGLYAQVMSICDTLYNFNINQQDSNGNTALHLALLKKHHKIAGLLLDYDANINIVNKKGETPIMICARQKFLYTIKRMLADYENINVNQQHIETKCTVMNYVLENEWYDICKEILKLGYDINLKDLDNMNLPMYVIYKGMNNLFEDIDFNKIDLTSIDTDGDSLLHYTIDDNLTELSMLVLQKTSMDINTKNNEGYTPFLTAVKRNEIDMIDILVASGADIYATDNDNKNALMIAIENMNYDMTDVMIELFDSKYYYHTDNKQQTALMIAIRKYTLEKDISEIIQTHYYELIEMLLDYTINNNVCQIPLQDTSGYSILGLLCYRSKEKKIQEFIKKITEIYHKQNYGFDPHTIVTAMAREIDTITSYFMN
jgi:ankyrin repeat protein